MIRAKTNNVGHKSFLEIGFREVINLGIWLEKSRSLNLPRNRELQLWYLKLDEVLASTINTQSDIKASSAAILIA